MGQRSSISVDLHYALLFPSKREVNIEPLDKLCIKCTEGTNVEGERGNSKMMNPWDSNKFYRPNLYGMSILYLFLKLKIY